MATADQVLGYGLVAPFRRDLKHAFAATGGVDLVRSCVEQVLGTFCGNGDQAQGELPWRTDFGSLLPLLRHRRNDFTTQELARTWVAQALARWEPRVRVTGLEMFREEAVPGGGENVLRLKVFYDILARPGSLNAVVVRGASTTVTVSP